MSFTGIDPARLFQILNNTQLQNKDNQLYQLLFNMISTLNKFQSLINSGSGGGGGGGSSSIVNNFISQFLVSQDAGSGDDSSVIMIGGSSTPTPSSGADYVVMSDGATPIPSPVDDGFGNFIYILYTP